ncbi:hypothetical protein WJX84_009501 [Apatococcus fuscideae]|uniref:Uncharacterized protein n=1 Tax=Apatococcus fuscideae TaxID=2026836 RepID=A0AAW1TJG0_9CHLO
MEQQRSPAPPRRLRVTNDPLNAGVPPRSTQVPEPWELPAQTGARPTSDIESGHEGLQLLACQGQWQRLREHLKAFRSWSDPEDFMSNAAFYILALTKLRQYTVAAEELTRLGDLDAAEHTEQSPSGPLSRIPFALRWLQAMLPGLQGQVDASVDLLSQLLDRCAGYAEPHDSPETPPARSPAGAAALPLSFSPERVSPSQADPLDEALDAGHLEARSISVSFTSSRSPHQLVAPSPATLKRRQQMIVLTIISLQLRSFAPEAETSRAQTSQARASAISRDNRAADWKAALSWLRWLLQCMGPDPLLLSRIGYVQLALGHLPAAEATFARAAAAAAAPAYGTDKAVQAAVRRNQGLLLTANQDYKGAAVEFEAILQRNPGDAVAANNAAVAKMYAVDLTGAVTALEKCLQASPSAHLREPLLVNLCSMYQLGAPAAAARSKRQLGQWAQKCAPDDFDLACIQT